MSKKKRHTKEEIDKFHQIILDLQKKSDFSVNITPQSTPKKQKP
jgi:hypothetical protein